MNYSDALNYIFSFTNFEVTPAHTYSSKTFDLTRMERLLSALDNPHTKFKSIHVAGTKGKGSTAAMIESVLRAANYSTGFYTSPHLHTFRERIRVNGAMITRDELVAGVEKLVPIVASIPGVTTFEVMTALAFDIFAARQVDFAILEVGLGGRLDATNVVTPQVSVITNISYDHMAILGNTLAEIASEKAGIIKPTVPVVSSPQTEEARGVIERIAKEKNATLCQVGQQSAISGQPTFEFQTANLKNEIKSIASNLDGQTFQLIRQDYQLTTTHYPLFTIHLPLLGEHQIANAATALATLAVLQTQGVAISDRAMQVGIRNVEWHGRFEILSRNPYLIIDGAHNGDSARQLIATLHAHFPHTPTHIIFGASGDKDIPAILAQLLPHAATLTLTQSRNPRAADPNRLAEIAAPYKIEMQLANDLASAIRITLDRAKSNDVICVTGSLFVVAEARAIWLAQQGIAVESDD